MNIDTIEDLFQYKLKLIYHIETHLSDKLTEMADKTSHEELSEEFESHQGETANQIKRLENIFEKMEIEPEEIEGNTMHGIFEENKEFENYTDNQDILDMYYKSGAIKIEYIEMSSYQSLIKLANLMGLNDEIIEELQDNHNEEQEALDSLQKIEIEV